MTTDRLPRMPMVVDDGGRAASGRRGTAQDCVCRAIAIATGLPYEEIYTALAAGNAQQRRSKRDPGPRVYSASRGIFTGRQWSRAYMESLGFSWHPCMSIGTGCQVHLAAGELPQGRLVVSISRHYTAVVDGVVHDIADPQRNGIRCVYGYWKLKTG